MQILPVQPETGLVKKRETEREQTVIGYQISVIGFFW